RHWQRATALASPPERPLQPGGIFFSFAGLLFFCVSGARLPHTRSYCASVGQFGNATCGKVFRTIFWRRNMKKSLIIVFAWIAFLPLPAGAQSAVVKAASFQAVPELPYRVVPQFFKFPKGMTAGEASAVAVNSKGHIFLFQRTKPMLAEYDEKGNFIQSIGEGLFSHPHGLRIDANDNIWTTDDGSHLVLKLDSSGNVLLVLGRIYTGAEANWRFNKPADVAFAKNGDIYVADGYGNSRVVKFDRDGNYIKAWGKYGAGIGEFNLPHSVAVDKDGFATTSLALRRPTKAINIPMPVAVECFRQSGMPLTICSRTPETVRTRKSTPEKKTTASAVGHGTCMLRQTA